MEPGNQCYTPIVEEQPCTPCPSAILFSSSLFLPRKARRQPYIKGTTPQKATTISLRTIKVDHTAEAEGEFVETTSRADDRELFSQKKEEEKVPSAIYLLLGGEDYEPNVPTFDSSRPAHAQQCRDCIGRHGEEGVRRKIFEADKKTNNVNLPNAATGFRLRTAR